MLTYIIGTLIFYPECCADSRGAHASVHLHQPNLDHPLLYPLPRIGVLSHLNAITEPCQKCTPLSYNGIPTDEREELVRDAQAILQVHSLSLSLRSERCVSDT